MSVVWNNVKFYVLAFAIVLAGALVSTGLQLLENLFPEIHPLSKLAANLSGMTLGGVMMLLAFLRDNRLDEERRRAENAQFEAKTAQEQAKTAQELAQNRPAGSRGATPACRGGTPACRPRRSRIAARDFPIPGRRPDRARSPA